MSTRSNSLSDSSAIDEAPLLGNHGEERGPGRGGGVGVSVGGLRSAARLLRQAGSRRMMREPSMLVRESATEQLEERRSDWAYSKPVVVLDMLWNLAFVIVTVGVLVASTEEFPSTPLRLWIVGYALQCGLHMVCVCIEYKRRQVPRRVEATDGSRSGEDGELQDEGSSSVAKHLESANTMFSFIWWIIGLYWVTAGGHALTTDAPKLYWLCIVFLAFDVFFVVFCVVLACALGVAVCCCLPCIIAILYAVSDQEGATDEDIRKLPKFKFRRTGDFDQLNSEISSRSSGKMTECATDTPIEFDIYAEDAECCICLSAYDDGDELRQLPCDHHFHADCLDKWLYINAICPLCKFNILNNVRRCRGDV